MPFNWFLISPLQEIKRTCWAIQQPRQTFQCFSRSQINFIQQNPVACGQNQAIYVCWIYTYQIYLILFAPNIQINYVFIWNYKQQQYFPLTYINDSHNTPQLTSYMHKISVINIWEDKTKNFKSEKKKCIFHKEEFHNLYISNSLTSVIKSRKIILAEHVPHITGTDILTKY